MFCVVEKLVSWWNELDLYAAKLVANLNVTNSACGETGVNQNRHERFYFDLVKLGLKHVIKSHFQANEDT